MGRMLYYTKSVCPVCIETVYAAIEEECDGIYMNKECKEHGEFKTLIWRDNTENYLKWLSFGGMDVEKLPRSAGEADREIGEVSFASEACVQPCSSALMTTNRCNNNCPVCFTRDNNEPLYEPSLDECKDLIIQYKNKAGNNALLELCGGEPTVREDIFEISKFASENGFDYIQLNTNGIELAKSGEYCEKLKANGITTVYLGFDGVTQKPYIKKYGRDILGIKKASLENCKKAGLAVVLVACVIPNVNDNELGSIIAFAKANMPTVKGIYLQPISYFGIYPKEDIGRITIPEVLRNLELQTDGEIKSSDFSPGTYEHPQCSFNGCFILDKDNRLKSLTGFSKKERNPDGYKRIRQSIKKAWTPSRVPMLTIGGMAFQDAWNIDMLRIMSCSVQIIGRDNKMIPLCSKYLTSCSGEKVHPGIN
jgi:uncharacterized radical SAM superfamily Fe-S cluster-containing enzyme